VPFLRNFTRDAAGALTLLSDTGLDGVTLYFATGTVGTCPEPCQARNIVSACRCDDTDGDGIADEEYVELLAVDCAGELTSIGTYTCDLTAPYAPASPVDCATADPGMEPVVNVRAHRVELAPGAAWDAATVMALRSATATAHTGDGTVTTTDGTTTLFRGESVTWAIDKDMDAALVGPLIITAMDGIVTVTYTQGV
jgi:hypothetical protein